MTTATTTPTKKTADQIANVWDVAVETLWDADELANGIIDYLDLRRPGLKVLDAACGTGLPGIAMNKAGVRTAMSDGSATMVERARAGCDAALGAAHGVDLRVSYWDQLHETWGEDCFDVIMIRGNSLPYVLNWDSGCGKALPSEDALRAGFHSLVRSMEAVKKCLKPGGRLFFDTSKKCDSSADCFVYEKRKTISSGEHVLVRWKAIADPVRSTRTWANDMTMHDKHGNVTRTLSSVISGLLTGPVQMRAALSYAGFTGFRIAYVPGEDVYQPYMVVDDSEDAARARASDLAKAVWNENGVMSYGLHNDVYPNPLSAADSTTTTTMKATPAAEANADAGVMAGPNAALRAWQARKAAGALGKKAVSSLVHVGCGSGRATLELVHAFRDSVRYAVGVDADPHNVLAARRLAADAVSRTGIAVEFHEAGLHEGSESLVLSSAGEHVTDGRKFAAAFAECALAQSEPAARRQALQAVYDTVEDGGVLVMSERVRGEHLPAPRVQLHYYERLGLGLADVWSAEQYIQELAAVGFKLVEFVDLTKQQAASYAKLAKRAGALAAQAEKGSAQENNLRLIETDYDISSFGAASGQTGWAQFVCRK